MNLTPYCTARSQPSVASTSRLLEYTGIVLPGHSLLWPLPAGSWNTQVLYCRVTAFCSFYQPAPVIHRYCTARSQTSVASTSRLLEYTGIVLPGHSLLQRLPAGSWNTQVLYRQVTAFCSLYQPAPVIHRYCTTRSQPSVASTSLPLE